MIVPMKKVSFVVMEKDSDQFLKKLRDVGVLHLGKKRVSPETLGELLVRRDGNRAAMGILARYPVKEKADPRQTNPSADMATRILDLMDERKARSSRTCPNS
jgi:V/A-type H+-transporting ATPase subunit I